MHDLRQDRAELVDDDVGRVDPLLQELRRQESRDLPRVLVAQVVEEARIRLLRERVFPAPPELDRLLADRQDPDLLPFGMRRDAVRRRAVHVRVEGAAEPPVAGHDDDDHAPLLARGEQRMHGRRAEPLPHGGEQVGDRLRVGPRADHPLLGAAQLRRRDHLHGLGDLLRALDRAQPAADVDEGSHVSRRLGVRRRSAGRRFRRGDVRLRLRFRLLRGRGRRRLVLQESGPGLLDRLAERLLRRLLELAGRDDRREDLRLADSSGARAAPPRTRSTDSTGSESM